MTRLQRDGIRTRARAWIRSLDRATVGRFLDDNVLGAFDWMDWFDDRPERGFVAAACEEAQRIEECDE